MQFAQQLKRLRFIVAIAFCLAASGRMNAQDADDSGNHAGYVPVVTGAVGYVHNVNAGVTTLEPQINPVLLVPFGSHLLLESRTEFTGFFQRENQTTGPFTGKVFKSVDYAQLDWLANSHLIATVGKYSLPFGIYSERLEPIWIKNIQDAPIDVNIGLRTSGAGDGFMLRGVATEQPGYTVQYSAYFSARSNINQLQAARTAGGDASIYLTHPRLELGGSYQRFLQDRQINNASAYVSWQPPSIPLDLKAQYDYTRTGNGYWLETAYNFDKLQIPSLLRRFQTVGRMQQFFALNGGGNGVPAINTQRFDFGLNYYIHDDFRVISSYGRSFSAQQDANIWNVGFTYRFVMPLWPERKK